MATYISNYTGVQIDSAVGRASVGGAIDTAISGLTGQTEELQAEVENKADVWDEFYITGTNLSAPNAVSAINAYVTAAGGFDKMPKAQILSFAYNDVFVSYIWMKFNGVGAYILETQDKDPRLFRTYIYLNGGSSLTQQFGSLAFINRNQPVNAANTDYTTYMARGEALFAADTNPTANGAISWKYE